VGALFPEVVINSLPSPAIEINALHNELCGLGQTSLEKAARIGELLTKQKAELPHGKWLPWFDANVQFSRKTGDRYRKLYKRSDEIKIVNMTNLSDVYSMLLTGKSVGKPSVPVVVTPDPADSEPAVVDTNLSRFEQAQQAKAQDQPATAIETEVIPPESEPQVDWRRRFRRELSSLIKSYVGALSGRIEKTDITEPEVWECAREYATRKAPNLAATINN
jgi:hypothetical protein